MNHPFIDFQEWRDEVRNDASGEAEEQDEFDALLEHCAENIQKQKEQA